MRGAIATVAAAFLAALTVVVAVNPPKAARAATPPPLLARPGTGQFEVVNGKIYDPTGIQFIPMGTNLNGPYSFFGEPTGGKAQLLADGWAANIVRLVTCEPSGCELNPYTTTTNNDLDAIVSEYTARHMVVLIDYHQVDPGKRATQANIDQAVAFWTSMARRYGSNPYVWFNLYNEPESRNHDWETGAPQDAFQGFWFNQHDAVIQAVRNVGGRNMLVIDDAETGQGAVDWFNIGTSPTADSGVLSRGTDLVARDPQRRTMFSVHVYDFWGWPAPENDQTCSQRWTDAQREDRLRSYLQRVADQKLAIMIGELGFFPSEQETTGKSWHLGGVASVPPCGSSQRLAAKAAYAVAPEFDVGVLTWHGFDLTTAGAQNWDLTGSPPNNLTVLGSWQYNYAHYQASRPRPTAPSPPASPAPASPGAFVSVGPIRLLDTRPGSDQVGYQGNRPGDGQTVVVDVAGAGVPANAASVALSVTAVQPSGAGFVTVWPCDAPRPLASNLNPNPTVATANLVITKPSAAGTVCLYTSNASHLIADLTGYDPAASPFVGIVPNRLLDTRPGTYQVGYQGGRPDDGQTVVLDMSGSGVPANAVGVALNVTAVEASRPGFVTVWPCDAPRPLASNLNPNPAVATANLVITKPSAAGTICLFTSTASHLVADLAGYEPSTSPFVGLVPSRLLDTRSGGSQVGYLGERPRAGQTVVLDVTGAGVPANAAGVMMSVTAVGPDNAGFVTVWPCDAPRPLASNLNPNPSVATANLVITRPSAAGTICLYTSSASHLIADVTGYES